MNCAGNHLLDPPASLTVVPIIALKFETLQVARWPYVKNGFIYDFFYDLNMINLVTQ